MTGVMIDFTGDQPALGSAKVEGFAALVQNAMVNIGTRQGTDPVYPDRGTNLQLDAAAGRLIDLNSAQHSSNFAALDTLSFSKETAGDETNGMEQVTLAPAEFTGAALSLEAKFQAADGQTVGKTIIL
jgi:hypothetical protein